MGGCPQKYQKEVRQADTTGTTDTFLKHTHTADGDVFKNSHQCHFAICRCVLIATFNRDKYRKHKLCIICMALFIGLAATLYIAISTTADITKQNTDLNTDPGAHASAKNYSDGTRANTPPTEPMVTFEHYGVLQDGRNVTRYTLRNDHMQVSIIDYGGIITQVMVPDKDGIIDDIVLGNEILQEYVGGNVLLGAIVGRYANLIAGNRFRLDGVKYDVDINGSSCRGFSKRLWVSHIEGDTLILTYNSPDDEDGFPGNVNVSVTYKLTESNELVITYNATTNKATVINLTNRSFFNMNGHTSGDLNDHTVSIDADYYTPLDSNQVPTGEIASVHLTMYDVRANTPLWPRLPRVPGDCGFDTNFAFYREGWDKHMARVTHRRNGRTLDVYSTEPGLQFNTGYHLQGIMGKGGVTYKQYGGLSLEAQHYPNSPNEPRFPTTIVRPGRPYTQTTKYVFGIEI